MTCVVGSVYAVMVTVPAVTGWKAMREALIAVLVAAVTAFAAVGFEPTVASSASRSSPSCSRSAWCSRSSTASAPACTASAVAG